MKKQTFSLLSILLLVIFAGTLLVSCGSSSKPSPSGDTDGLSLMQERCSVCHSTSRITSAHKTAAEWTTTVERMVGNGAQINAQEQQTLVDYLAANYK